MEEKIDEVATQAAAEVFAAAVGFTNDKWLPEVETLLNVKIPQQARDGMILEALFYGTYYIENKFSYIFSGESLKEVIDEFHKNIIYYLSSVYFKSLDPNITKEKHRQDISDMFYEFYPERKNTYSSSVEPIAETLSNFLIMNFYENSPVKFIQNTLTNRIKLKAALALGGSQLEGNRYYDDKIIMEYVKTLTAFLMEINLSSKKD